MGKKLNSSSMKISTQLEEEKQLNNMIKVLKPKVYITDSSSFKKLVQELTGDTNGSAAFPDPPNLHMPRHHNERPDPFVEAQDDNVFLESSFEFSLDSGNNSLAKQEMEFPEYKDIESWLLEIDQFQSYDAYASMAHPEACDYDISRLI